MESRRSLKGEQHTEASPPLAWRSEEELARAWGAGLLPPGLRTTWGQSLRVLFPGWPNAARGPDFRAAVLARGEGEPVQGEVEVHLRARSWTAHGHHRDPEYNGVVLHLVASADGETSSRRQDGALVPLLEVPSPAIVGAGLGGDAPSAPEGLTLAGAARAGEARFAGQSAALEGEMTLWGPEEALYRGLLGALGYAKNARPFQEVARRLPLAVLRGLVGGLTLEEREAALAGLLIGAAGLLPSQRLGFRDGLFLGDGYTRNLEAAWRRLGGGEPLPPGSWTLFRVRPENHPLRRLGAATALLLRYLETDLPEAFAVALRGPSPSEACRSLQGMLRVGPAGYWAEHGEFGRRKERPSALVGTARAGEMAVSVVLPFLAAYGRRRDEGDLVEAAWAAYRHHPVPGGNGLARLAAGRLLDGDQGVPTALHQQGLLHWAQGLSSAAASQALHNRTPVQYLQDCHPALEAIQKSLTPWPPLPF